MNFTHDEPPSIPFEDLPERLKRARKKLGVDQHEMAAIIGVHRRTIANYEGGNTEPPRTTIMIWAQATNVPVMWLAYGSTEGQAREEAPDH